ncbi:hypothetical protein H2198_000450 [Neophaeococcomyces mojaviensis]|uniref:Uncharacterized protein n=1 Tax=Neophaeococcomyces mojaviensis TaxID=3383035 RepID=A0ACC3AK39_9EURO|nr:hypothetical protein H2198_000450 [Knufia sp. JES_112]
MSPIANPNFDANTEGITAAAAFPAFIKDRTILITGVNRKGIGYTTAEAFASQSPSHLIFAGRSTSKVQECIDALSQTYPSVTYRFLPLDLSSQESVKTAASEVLSWTDIPTIDLLVNNAAVMALPERTLTKEGIEMHLATNHIGHFLLTNLLMPKLIAAAQNAARGSVRVVNISSLSTYVSPIRFSDLDWSKPTSEIPDSQKPNLAIMRAAELQVTEKDTYMPLAAYGSSKTANIAFSTGVNQKVFEKHGVLSVALHPGEMKSELARHLDQAWYAKMHSRSPYKTLQAGASTTLVAACDPRLAEADLGQEQGTLFLNNCQVMKAPAYATDKEIAKKLWKVSEELVGENFTY